jgi:cation diffusion facilitator family transporter
MIENQNPYREGRSAALLGIALSLALGLVKCLGGIIGHSLALLSDAVHSLVDAAVSGALLAALYVAERPADREHPYGHGKAEAVAGAGVALLLLVLAAGITREAIVKIRDRPKTPATFTLVIAACCGLFQEGLFRYTSRVARRTGSDALMGTAWDYRLDALGAAAVLLGVALARWGGPAWHWADHVAALVVAALVFWAGGRLLRENIDNLMDRQADPALLAEVRREAASVAGVRAVEKLRMRKVGLEYLVDIHIQVDPKQTVEIGHTIAHAVKDRIISEVKGVRDVLVHIEPDGSTARRRTAELS